MVGDAHEYYGAPGSVRRLAGTVSSRWMARTMGDGGLDDEKDIQSQDPFSTSACGGHNGRLKAALGDKRMGTGRHCTR